MPEFRSRFADQHRSLLSRPRLVLLTLIACLIGLLAPAVPAFAAVKPTAPSVTSVVPGNGQAVVTFAPPTDDGGSTVTGYKVTATPTTGTGTVTKNVTGSPATVTGLGNGREYAFTVVATNAAGDSPASPAVKGTPITVSSAPSLVSVSPADKSAIIRYNNSTNNGGSTITGYTATLQYTDADGNTQSLAATCSSSPCTASGLTNGTTYVVSIVANNAAGSSPSNGALPVTPVGPPETAPTINSAVPGNASVLVTYSPPASTGGLGITGYTLTAVPAGGGTTLTRVPTGSPYNFTQLVNGKQYSFTLVASNAKGPSPVSAPVTATPVSVPGKPTLSVTAGDKQVVATFNTPADNGSAIAGYTIVTTSAGTPVPTTSCTGSPCTVSGLTNGTSYSFTVVATNGVGDSPTSTAATATPNVLPGKPTGLTAVYSSGGGQPVTVSWSLPVDNGGTAPLSYEWRYVGDDLFSSWQTRELDKASVVPIMNNGHSYEFQVRALNAAGAGEVATLQVTPDLVPPQVTNLVATAGTGSVSVSFSAPALAFPASMFYIFSPVTRYEYQLDGDTSWTPLGMNTSFTIDNLAAGVYRTVSVRAVNAKGAGLEQIRGFTPAGTPGKVTQLKATPGDRSAQLTWSAPTGSGPGITYEWRYAGSGDSGWAATSSPGVQLLLLTNGTPVTVEVRAKNTSGTGPLDSVTVTPDVAPNAVGNLTAVPGDTRATLTWDAPADNSGTAITRYEYQVSGATGWISNDTSRSVDLAGLSNGTTTFYVVRAVNAAGPGQGAAVAVSPRKPLVPLTIDNLVATPGNHSITATWDPPSNPGGSAVARYEYKLEQNGSQVLDWTSGTTKTNVTIDSLTNGQEVIFYVRAVDVDGVTHNYQYARTTPNIVPGPVTLPEAARGDKQVQLFWGYPVANGGTGVNFYEYRQGTTGKWTQLSYLTPAATVTGLTNGEPYTFEIRARNAMGPGEISTVSATPDVVPAAVKNLDAVPGDSSSAVSWGTPADNGGTPILGYEWTIDNITWHDVGMSTSVVVTGLTYDPSGASPSFLVRAYNAAGKGAGQFRSVFPLKPPTVPSAVTDLADTTEGRSATVTWDDPDDDGGSALKRYEYKVHEKGDFFDPSGDEGWTSTDLRESATLSDLTYDTVYRVYVRAFNGVGSSPITFHDVVVRKPIPPLGKVTDLMAVPGDGTVQVTWGLPEGFQLSDPGFHYEYKVGDAADWTYAGLTPKTLLTGLTNGTPVTVHVRANRGSAPGPVNDVSATPAAVPDAPVLTITPGDTKLTVAFPEPAANGSPIRSYELTVYGTLDGSFTNPTCLASPCVLTGLTNGFPYVVRARAVNGVGAGNYSEVASGIPFTIPGPVTSLSGTVGDAASKVTWQEPTDNGGRPISGYQYQLKGANDWSDLNATTRSFSLSGLTNGETYTYLVRAVNEAGAGPSTSVIVIPVKAAGVPFKPVITSATPGDAQVIVVFDDPDINGSPIRKRTISYLDGGLTKSVDCTSPCAITALTNGTTYAFTLTVTNGVGTSAASEPKSATPVAAPGAVRQLTATAGDSAATVTWKAPAIDGGSAIQKYWVKVGSADPVEFTGAPDAQGLFTYAASGLSNGTSHDVTVWAVNAVGSGEKTTKQVTPSKPAGRPGTPAIGSVTAGDGQVEITFTDPDANGSPITGRTISYQENGQTKTAPCTTSPCTIKGLTNGVNYTFTMVVTNGVGDSPASDGVDATPKAPVVTPPATRAPGAVRELTAVPGDGLATLTWKAPTDEGTSKVSGYEIKLGDQDWASAVLPTPVGGVFSQVIPGLVNGSTYDVQVRAVSDAGTGPATTVRAKPVKKAGKPGAPRQVAATITGTTALVTWLAPLSDGGSPIVDYVVTTGDQYSPKSCIASAMGLTTCTITGLTAGKSYVFSVVARNTKTGVEGTGTGPAATSTKVCVTKVAGAPTALQGSSTYGTLSLTWNRPGNPGTSAITGYEVSLDAGKTWKKVSTTGTDRLTAKMTGLRKGTTYPVRVRARNTSGSGAPSNQVSVKVS